MKPKISGLLGLARRAQKLAVGLDDLSASMANKRCRLVLIANDCSENSTKKANSLCSHYKVASIEIDASKSQLGSILGLPEVAAIGICDKGFTKAIMNELDNMEVNKWDIR